MRDAGEESAAVVGAFWTLGAVPVVVVDAVAMSGGNWLGWGNDSVQTRELTGQRCRGSRLSSRQRCV